MWLPGFLFFLFSTSFVHAQSVEDLSLSKVIDVVYEVIKEGKPTVVVGSPEFRALPKGAGQLEMSGWERKVLNGKWLTKSQLFDIPVIEMDYVISMRLGGALNGKGRFINSVKVTPRKIKVLWGYNFFMEVRLMKDSPRLEGDPMNPVAVMDIQVDQTVMTWVRTERYRQRYRIRGDGVVSNLDSGQIYFSNDPFSWGQLKSERAKTYIIKQKSRVP